MSERVEKLGWYGQTIQIMWVALLVSRTEPFIHSLSGLLWMLVILIGTPWFLVSLPCAAYFLVRLVSNKLQGAAAPERQIALASLYVIEAILVAVRGFDS